MDMGDINIGNTPEWVLLILGLYWFVAQIFPSIWVGRKKKGDESETAELISEYKDVIKQLKNGFDSAGSNTQKLFDKILDLFQKNNEAIISIAESYKDMTRMMGRLCDTVERLENRTNELKGTFAESLKEMKTAFNDMAKEVRDAR